MPRHICVLANSVKFQGRCIAGKEVIPATNNSWNLTNTWLRPLGAAPRGELHWHEYRCGNASPGLLDLVSIPFDKPVAVPGQPEDYSIIAGRPWVAHGTFGKGVATQLLDAPHDLWLEYPAHSDRVSTNYLVANHAPSLQLISVSNLTIALVAFTHFSTGCATLKRRCRFTYQNVNYDLALTDPAMQAMYFPSFPNCPSGVISPGPATNSIICVSLTPALKGMHYKLVAAVFA